MVGTTVIPMLQKSKVRLHNAGKEIKRERTSEERMALGRIIEWRGLAKVCSGGIHPQEQQRQMRVGRWHGSQQAGRARVWIING